MEERQNAMQTGAALPDERKEGPLGSLSGEMGRAGKVLDGLNVALTELEERLRPVLCDPAPAPALDGGCKEDPSCASILATWVSGAACVVELATKRVMHLAERLDLRGV